MGMFHLKAEQMQALNGLLIILLIPLFESCLYPCLRMCRIPTRPLQRMVAGMVLAALAFVMAGCLQLWIDSTAPKPLLPHRCAVLYVMVKTVNKKNSEPYFQAG